MNSDFDTDHSSAWGFIRKFYPGYDTSKEIEVNITLHDVLFNGGRYVGPDDVIVNEQGVPIGDNQMKDEYQRTLINIYQKSINNYLKLHPIYKPGYSIKVKTVFRLTGDEEKCNSALDFFDSLPRGGNTPIPQPSFVFPEVIENARLWTISTCPINYEVEMETVKASPEELIFAVCNHFGVGFISYIDESNTNPAVPYTVLHYDAKGKQAKRYLLTREEEEAIKECDDVVIFNGGLYNDTFDVFRFLLNEKGALEPVV